VSAVYSVICIDANLTALGKELRHAPLPVLSRVFTPSKLLFSSGEGEEGGGGVSLLLSEEGGEG